MTEGSAATPVRRAGLPAEESLLVAVSLSLAGGYLDAFTWLVHDGVLANAQTANVVLLAVYAATGHHAQAIHYMPPIFAFVVGVFVACALRQRLTRSRQISLVIEIVMLILVMWLHLRLPEVAGILGISFAAALQTTAFVKVEGWSYSSVMTTGNLRQSAEALYAGLRGTGDPAHFRRAWVFGVLCLSFGSGAALGAFLTSQGGVGGLVVPIGLLGLALVLCGFEGQA